MHINGGVNWGRGRLRKHESFYSFVAKFAVLNGLSHRRAWKFLSGRLGLSHQGSFLATDDQVAELARLLDEPADVVLTLRSGSHDIPRWAYPIFDVSGFMQPLVGIRYCSECVKGEYHAFFHQLGYLSFCPIHKLGLQYEKPRFYTVSATRLECNLLLLADIFQRNNPSWPKAPEGDPSLPDVLETQDSIDSCVSWSRDVCEKLADVGSRKVWSTVARMPLRHRGSNGAACSLGAITAYFGVPQTVAKLFPEIPAMTVKKRFYSSSVANATGGIFDDEGVLWEVLDVYRRWWAWSKQPTFRGEQLVELLNRLRSDHGNCDCRWVWTHSTDWIRRQIGARKRPRQECAYDLLMSFIGQRWGDLAWLPQKKTNIHLEYYANSLHRLETMGLVELDGRGNDLERLHDPVRNVQVTWRLPQQVIELIETLLSTELEMHVEEWVKWLEWMKRDEDPAAYDAANQYCALLRLDEGFELVQWKEENSKAY